MARPRTVLAACAMGLALLLNATASAAMDIPSEKLVSYAHLYPEVFRDAVQPVAYHPATPRQAQAVSLLLQSFNGDTDVESLSTLISAGGAPTESGPLKSESQLKTLVSASGLSWEEYEEITHTLAKDPTLFQQFLAALDKERASKTFLGRAVSDPGFLKSLHGNDSGDHQAIVRHLLMALKK